MAVALVHIRRELRALGSPERARVSRSFFKTGRGEYGEGDRFLGVQSADLRRLARQHQTLARRDVLSLLRSPIHEERQLALLIMVEQFERGGVVAQRSITETYLAHTRYVNNWDLVDLSAYKILGRYLLHRPRGVLRKFARSQNLWERRIAIISTMELIAHEQFSDTLIIAEMLLRDHEDLIHKAVGWMLREIGKRDRAALEVFLRSHYQEMPRTMLRYAIERFPEWLRQRYLKDMI